jgi:hypothetical protein
MAGGMGVDVDVGAGGLGVWVGCGAVKTPHANKSNRPSIKLIVVGTFLSNIEILLSFQSGHYD